MAQEPENEAEGSKAKKFPVDNFGIGSNLRGTPPVRGSFFLVLAYRDQMCSLLIYLSYRLISYACKTEVPYKLQIFVLLLW
jgi:hypothetical protein